MNLHRTRFLVASLSFAGLLHAAVSHATDVSKLPLRYDAKAKPNVIFGMDDSSSMNIELMQPGTKDGMAWWDANAERFWINGVFQSTGTALGGLFGTSNSGTVSGMPPPSPQFAALRSSAYNPLYYDPLTTYEPWPPAYHDGAERIYGPANPKATKSNPARSNSSTVDLTTDRAWTLTYRKGMLKPDGNKAAGDEPIETAVYPATYWVREPCAIEAGWNSNCAPGPVSGVTLKRYQIKNDTRTYPSGRSYDEEMQNFANWWSYARNRRLMLADKMGKVLNETVGVRMAVVPFNRRTSVTMYDMDVEADRRKVMGVFYANPVSAANGTPTAAALNFIGTEFHNNGQVIIHSCQRNNAFIVTDGLASDQVAAPTYDRTLYGAAWPYSPVQAGSVSDIALAYYTLNARNGRTETADVNGVKRPLVDGRVAEVVSPANPDNNTNLHVNTFAITMGLSGRVWPGVTDAWSGKFSTWPTDIRGSIGAIDDLWHATVNGRGQMYGADTPKATAEKIRQALTEMVGQVRGQLAPVIADANLARGTGRVYQASYVLSEFSGDVTARVIDKRTGEVDKAAEVIWSASARLKAMDWSKRRIYTAENKPFNHENVGALLGGNAALVDYLRGKRDGEGSVYRQRQSLLGPVLNAKPVVGQPASANEHAVIYVATGEGMLHALDEGSGEELWAYVPKTVLPSLAAISTPDANIRKSADNSPLLVTQLDGTPSLVNVAGRTLLVAGRGVAGAGYYALDVSTPRSEGPFDKALWDIGPSPQFTFGLSVGRPLVVDTSAGPVALLPQGYNGSNDGVSRVYMVNAITGEKIHTFNADSGSGSGDPGLAQLSAFREPDGKVVHVYGGDERGNLWHLNLVDRTITRLAQLKDAQGQAQPVTTAPELVMQGGARVVIVGTGRMLGASDMNASSPQTLYAVKDGPFLENARTALVQRIFGAETNGARTVTGTDVMDWFSDRGWYLDLPAGEQANVNIAVGLGAVFAVTNQVSENTCSAKSYLNVINLSTGKSHVSVLLGLFLSSGATLAKAGDKVISLTTNWDTAEVVARDPNIPFALKARKNGWRQILRD